MFCSPPLPAEHDESFMRPIRLIFSEDEWSFWREFFSWKLLSSLHLTIPWHASHSQSWQSLSPHTKIVEYDTYSWSIYIEKMNITTAKSSRVDLFLPRTALALARPSFCHSYILQRDNIRNFLVSSYRKQLPVQRKGVHRFSPTMVCVYPPTLYVSIVHWACLCCSTYGYFMVCDAHTSTAKFVFCIWRQQPRPHSFYPLAAQCSIFHLWTIHSLLIL